MNEQTKQILNEKLLETLSWVEQTVKSGESFLVEQTPLYIQELLAWNFWYSLIWFVLGLVLLGVTGHCIKTAKRIGWDSDDVFPLQLYSVFGGIFSLILGFVFTSHNLEWLQIKIAPRVWLVEYLQEMIR